MTHDSVLLARCVCVLLAIAFSSSFSARGAGPGKAAAPACNTPLSALTLLGVANHCQYDGWTALMIAANYGKDGVVAKLLRAGADPSPKDKVPVAMLSHARWCAAERHRCFHAHVHFSFSSSACHLPQIGWTAMDWAVGKKHDAIAKVLREHASSTTRTTSTSRRTCTRCTAQ